MKAAAISTHVMQVEIKQRRLATLPEGQRRQRRVHAE